MYNILLKIKRFLKRLLGMNKDYTTKEKTEKLSGQASRIFVGLGLIIYKMNNEQPIPIEYPQIKNIEYYYGSIKVEDDAPLPNRINFSLAGVKLMLLSKPNPFKSVIEFSTYEYTPDFNDSTLSTEILTPIPQLNIIYKSGGNSCALISAYLDSIIEYFKEI
jgi:hypothetical protein